MDQGHVRTATLAAPARFVILTVVVVVAILALAPAAHAASGDLVWQRQVVGPSNGAAAFTALVPAPGGGVYPAGWIFNATGDMLAARYSAGGQRLWLRSLDFSLHAYDSVHAAASDRKGDLIVVGQVDYPSGSESEAIVKYGPGGGLKWVRHYDDPSAGQDTQVTTDAHGNVYVTTLGATNDIVLLKYSPSGTRRWLRTYTGPVNEQPQGIAVDGPGNVYVTGLTYSTASHYDIVTFKYDPAGHRRWARTWDGPASGNDEGFAIAVTRSGTAYVAGESAGLTTGEDAMVLKYGTGGNLMWSHRFSSAGVNDDWFNKVTLLANGDVAATGGTSPGGAQDVLTARLSASGHIRWSHTFNGADNLSDQGLFVAGGPGDAVYVAGWSEGATTSYDILMLKYNKLGHQSWARRFAGAGTSFDLAQGLVVNDHGVYVAGQEDVTPTTAVLLKYKP